MVELQLQRYATTHAEPCYELLPDRGGAKMPTRHPMMLFCRTFDVLASVTELTALVPRRPRNRASVHVRLDKVTRGESKKDGFCTKVQHFFLEKYSIWSISGHNKCVCGSKCRMYVWEQLDVGARRILGRVHRMRKIHGFVLNSYSHLRHQNNQKSKIKRSTHVESVVVGSPRKFYNMYVCIYVWEHGPTRPDPQIHLLWPQKNRGTRPRR